MKHIYDVLIIGGGPSGYTAALYTARAGLDTLVAEGLYVGGQMALTGVIDNYPGFDGGIDGFTLATKMQGGAEAFGAKTLYASIQSVDFSGVVKKAFTSDGVILAKSVIIASGASPRHLGITGENELVGNGLHYCAHCDGRFYKDKTVAVVGGGNSAVSDAIYLSRLAKKVILIHRRAELRATKIYREHLLSLDNVRIITNAKITEFIKDDRLCGVVIENTETGEKSNIACDGLFVSIGRQPTTEFLNGTLTLDENGYIVADESTKTSVDGVFAAGDVRTKPLRQIVTAASDGAVAADAAEKYLSALTMGKVNFTV